MKHRHIPQQVLKNLNLFPEQIPQHIPKEDYLTAIAYAYIKVKKARRNMQEDALGEALLALWESAQKFDATQGVKFITFAMFRIDEKVIEYGRKNYAQVNVFTTKAAEAIFYNYFKFVRAHASELEGKPLPEHLAQKFCNEYAPKEKGKKKIIPLDKFRTTESFLLQSNQLSMDKKRTENDQKDGTFHDVIPASNQDIISLIQKDEMITITEEAFSKPTSNGQEIFYKHLLSATPQNSLELALEYDCSHQNIRTTKKTAGQKIRAHLKEHNIDRNTFDHFLNDHTVEVEKLSPFHHNNSLEPA